MIASFKNKRLLAVVLMFTFAWLSHVAAAPLRAADKPATVAGENDNPGAVEQGGMKSYGGHSSALPIIIGVVAVAAIAAVLILVVFKTTYDITGNWNVVYQWSTGPSHTDVYSFTGTKTSGTFIETGFSDTGTYSVNGKNVSWTINGAPTTYTGTFSGKDTMSGTMNNTYMSGTWSATRVGTPQAHPKGMGTPI